MILPNAERAIINVAKVVDYLLNPTHPDNGGKAAFFFTWGFLRSNSDVLDRAVRDMIIHTEVASQSRSPWGEKYIVDGAIQSPRGRTPDERTIWIIDDGQEIPRLVTAYPC